MEVFTKESKSGKIYRINEWNPVWHLYGIEYQKIYEYDDGTPCSVWLPAFEPEDKIFTNLEDAKAELEKLLEN